MFFFSRMSTHELRPEHKDILMNLPILKTLDKSGEKPARFVSVNVRLYISFMILEKRICLYE